MKTEEKIYCSECYDEIGFEHFSAIAPQSKCARCGRKCLGYVVVNSDELEEENIND